MRILLGIDVGTTNSKVLATTDDGREIAVRSMPTQWSNAPGGRVQIDPWQLADSVIGLAVDTVRAAGEAVGPVSVGAIGLTGMAESGVLIGADGRPRNDVIAWFDPRGRDEIAALPTSFARQFPAVTGLPVGSQVTFAKLLWLGAHGVELRGAQWLHVPELIAYRLTGRRSAETSLLARSGLLDQESGELWPMALDRLGVDTSVIPRRVHAGEPLGAAAGDACPDPLRDAIVTVAGHDHPVAALGCGADDPEMIFDSFGTAEVFLRTVDHPMSGEERAATVRAGVNVVRSVLPGRWHLLAGTKSGLLMRRALALLGVDREARDALDEAAMALGDQQVINDIGVTGAANDDGVLTISAPSDDVTPAALWLAVVRHGIDEGNKLLAVMCPDDSAVPPAVVAGGWTRMASVRREKHQQLPRARFSDRAQAGAFGAAALAAAAQDPSGPNQATIRDFVGTATSVAEGIAG